MRKKLFKLQEEINRINECLKEVELALDALGTQYSVLTKYTY
jgi:predicted  nucleic acid-binding Zn-ribbon protein